MEDGSSEVKMYLRLFLGWWWFFVLGVVGAAAATFTVIYVTTPIYESTAQIVVERFRKAGAPETIDARESMLLATSYADLVKMRPILEEVASRLPVSYTAYQLSENIKVDNISKTLQPTTIIKITASDPDPVIAATIANTTAITFTESLLDRQLSQLVKFQETLARYGIEQGTETVANQAASLGALSVISPAVPSALPANKSWLKTLVYLSVAVLIGFLIPGLVVVLGEYLDERIKSPDTLKNVTGKALLASIPRYRGRYGSPIDSDEHDVRYWSFAESFNLLLTNLEFASSGKPNAGTLLITSAGISEGKSSTAANLAISAARHGRSVILVDCDLRDPSLHRFFDLGDQKGLTQLITGGTTLKDTLASPSIEGLHVIASGPMLADPGVALSSPAMNSLVQELKKRVDLVIFDGPPVIAVTDPLLLAPLVDSVLLVVQENRTTGAAVRQAMDLLGQVDANVVGVVLNKVKADETARAYSRYYRKYVKNSRANRVKAS